MSQKNMISRLQYITRRSRSEDILAEVAQFIEGGGDWVQLRMKDAAPDYFLQTAINVGELCRANGVTFIINDNPDIALNSGADGVHIGKSDISVSEAREILGEDMIIGRTANCFEDLAELSDMDIDYIGMGPYRWTTTKKNIAEILGLDGYKEAFEAVEFHNLELPPIVAIGSVGVDDIVSLSSVKGLWGVAVSAAIGEAKSPSDTTRQMRCLIDQTFGR